MWPFKSKGKKIASKARTTEAMRKEINLGKTKIGDTIRFNNTTTQIWPCKVINNKSDDRKIYIRITYSNTNSTEDRVYTYDDPVFVNFNVLNVFDTIAEKRDKKLAKI